MDNSDSETKDTPINNPSFELTAMSQVNKNRVCQELIQHMEEMTKYFQMTFKDMAKMMTDYKGHVERLKNQFHVQNKKKSEKPPINRKNDAIYTKRDEDILFGNIKIPGQTYSLNINSNAPTNGTDPISLGIDITDDDLEGLQSTLPNQLDFDDIDLQLFTPKEPQGQLWEQFRDIERARIKKAEPLQNMSLIDDFILKRWNSLSAKERASQVAIERKKQAEISKLLKKQHVEEYNEIVKDRFQQLINKKSKREMAVEKAESKQIIREQKVQAADLRALLQKGKTQTPLISPTLEEKLKKIFMEPS